MICQKCKTLNDDGDTFCRECGTAIQSSGQMPTAQFAAGSFIPHAADAAAPSANNDVLIGHIIDGRYRIDARLGTGGMGAVYRGTRLLIGDEVAIKILNSDQVSVPQAAERFRREAQSAARLKHPNAVSVYDFGVSQDGLFYLVMELVVGESVRSLIKERGPFTPEAAAEVITQVCSALDEAHRQSIIHRDIKPDNIMVYPAASGLRVKVLDFGIAKMRDQPASNLTQTGSVMGTPHYMSPEQCVGEDLDNRSDIYSLGIVLYEMLAGVVPFNSPTSTAVVIQHVNQAPLPLRAINMNIPSSVEAATMHALEKRREARPQTAGMLAQELNAAVNMANARPSIVQTASHAALPMPTSGAIPTAGSGIMPTMVMAATPPSGSRAVTPANASQFTSRSVPARGRVNPILIALGVLAIAAIGAVTYLFLLRGGKQEGPVPDHFGIFVRTKDTLDELRRTEFRDVVQGRDTIMGDSSLPRVDAKPTLILFAEAQDIPLSELKLIQLDAIDPGGKVSYWNYQVAPIDGHPSMKQIRVTGGLPSGKYAFALLNGYLDEGNHRFWPFQVKDGGAAPSDTPQETMIQLKPKPTPTPRQINQTPPVPQTALPPPASAGLAYCTENNVVLRSAPNLNGPKIGRLSKGERLFVIELSSNYDTWRGVTANWAYVQPENSSVRGWVFTYFVRR
jgi:serine/threonine protein kinase